MEGLFSELNVETDRIDHAKRTGNRAGNRLPVVNIGIRQQGRVAGTNVIHAGDTAAEISAAIAKACSPEFRKQIASMKNPYGDGKAAERIVERLETASIDEKLLVKKFHDI